MKRQSWHLLGCRTLVNQNSNKFQESSTLAHGLMASKVQYGELTLARLKYGNMIIHASFSRTFFHLNFWMKVPVWKILSLLYRLLIFSWSHHKLVSSYAEKYLVHFKKQLYFWATSGSVNTESRLKQLYMDAKCLRI